MIHDPDLLDKLATFKAETFEGQVFRATRSNLDPIAFSTRGGRWAPADNVAVLYTSLEADGALAEIAFHWSQMTPRPTKPVVLHTLRVSVQQTLRLLRTDLSELGVDMLHFGDLDNRRTQEIGAAVSFLECDGLLVPSARWDCENLILFNDTALHTKLEVVGCEERDWRVWCKDHGQWEPESAADL